MHGGIIEVKELSFKINVNIDDNLQIDDGILPYKKFESRSKFESENSLSTSGGIVPIIGSN
jgi:hypothetical protein